MTRTIVVTDLDGTLLDAETYAWDAARPGLARLVERHIPLVICTSKTRAEVLPLIDELEAAGLLAARAPFVVENGGAVFFPERASEWATSSPANEPGADDVAAARTRPSRWRGSVARDEERAGGWRLAPHAPRLEAPDERGWRRALLGSPYPPLRATLAALRGQGFAVRGFGDMDDAEVARLTGLSEEAAGRARQREFDEPFVHEGPPEQLPQILAAIEARGLHHTEGRLLHVKGASDKGRALRLVLEAYQRTWAGETSGSAKASDAGFAAEAAPPLDDDMALYATSPGATTDAGEAIGGAGAIVSIGLGDGPNDVPLLAQVTHPVLIRRPEGDHHPRALRELEALDVAARLYRSEAVGPAGFAESIARLVG